MKNGSLSFKQLPCQDILYKVIHFCIHKISGENMRSTNWSHLFGIGAFLWNPQYGDSFFAHKVLGKWVHLISHVSPYFTFFNRNQSAHLIHFLHTKVLENGFTLFHIFHLISHFFNRNQSAHLIHFLHTKVLENGFTLFHIFHLISHFFNRNQSAHLIHFTYQIIALELVSISFNQISSIQIPHNILQPLIQHAYTYI